MATVGVISHDQFPADICVSYRAAGENVGVAGTGNMQNDIQTVFNIMMGEPHDPTTCATTANHACNILSKTFTQAGIGIYYASGSTWITEDFIG